MIKQKSLNDVAEELANKIFNEVKEPFNRKYQLLLKEIFIKGAIWAINNPAWKLLYVNTPPENKNVLCYTKDKKFVIAHFNEIMNQMLDDNKNPISNIELWMNLPNITFQAVS